MLLTPSPVSMWPWIYVDALHSRQSMTLVVSAQSHLNFQSDGDPLLMIQAFFSDFPALVLSLRVPSQHCAHCFLICCSSRTSSFNAPCLLQSSKSLFNVKTMMPPLLNKDIQIQHTFPDIAATLALSERLFSFESIWWGLLWFWSSYLWRYGSIRKSYLSPAELNYIGQQAPVYTDVHSPEKDFGFGVKGFMSIEWLVRQS